MKTWIVTLEVIGFVLAYFLARAQDRADEIDVTFPNPNSRINCCNEQELWPTIESTLEEHIRPPPHQVGRSFFSITQCWYKQIMNQQALSFGFRPFLLEWWNSGMLGIAISTFLIFQWGWDYDPDGTLGGRYEVRMPPEGLKMLLQSRHGWL